MSRTSLADARYIASLNHRSPCAVSASCSIPRVVSLKHASWNATSASSTICTTMPSDARTR